MAYFNYQVVIGAHVVGVLAFAALALATGEPLPISMDVHFAS